MCVYISCNLLNFQSGQYQVITINIFRVCLNWIIDLKSEFEVN